MTLHQIDNHHADEPANDEKGAGVKQKVKPEDREDAVVEHDNRHFDSGNRAAVDEFHGEDKLENPKG